jgi:SMC interacting uncharacterized protein involved in chromosome segregation
MSSSPLRSVAGLLLVGAATLLLVACNPFRQEAVEDVVRKLQDDARDEIRSAVADQDRREAMLDHVDRLYALIAEGEAVLDRLRRQERELFSDYDSTVQDYEAMLAAYRAERRALQRDVLQTHLALKSTASEDEWPRISAAQARAVTAMVQAAEANVFSRQE